MRSARGPRWQEPRARVMRWRRVRRSRLHHTEARRATPALLSDTVARVPVLAAILCIACTSFAGAQTRPADRPLPPAPKPNFSGDWTLNRELSDEPRAPRDDARGGDHQRENGRHGGFGGYGGRRGGFGYPGAGRGAPAPDAADDRARIQEVLRDARSPSPNLTISHSPVNIAITEAGGRTRFFQTTGATDKHQFDAGTVDSTTTWNGEELVTAYDLGSGRRLTYTYALASGGRQLVVRVRVEGGGYGARGPTTTKYVYDAVRSK